ncbi:chemotaxis protein [Pseudomonas sp. Cab53]|nr:chemotaxis protein [Pseudomonas sp. Cab53]
MFVAYIRDQRQVAAQQAQGDALRDQRIKELAKRVDDYQNGTVRMGEALHELRAVVAPLPDKLAQLEQRDPSTLSFAQAARLVGMGASIDELTQACGLTQAEAELMSKLHKGG